MLHGNSLTQQQGFKTKYHYCRENIQAFAATKVRLLRKFKNDMSVTSVRIEKFISLKSAITTLKINIYNGHPVAVKIILHFFDIGSKSGANERKRNV